MNMLQSPSLPKDFSGLVPSNSNVVNHPQKVHNKIITILHIERPQVELLLLSSTDHVKVLADVGRYEPCLG